MGRRIKWHCFIQVSKRDITNNSNNNSIPSSQGMYSKPFCKAVLSPSAPFLWSGTNITSFYFFLQGHCNASQHSWKKHSPSPMLYKPSEWDSLISVSANAYPAQAICLDSLDSLWYKTNLLKKIHSVFPFESSWENCKLKFGSDLRWQIPSFEDTDWTKSLQDLNS